jgi:uncharacterized protein
MSRRPRALDPRSLDIAAFCREGASLEGQWALDQMPRLAEGTLRMADGGGAVPPVHWAARGRVRPARGGDPHLMLDLSARAEVSLACQRCLQPVTVPLVVDRQIRFVAGEDEAARLDEEGEEDVLALGPRFDLGELVEDELLLALPFVPRHEVCPIPVGASTPSAVTEVTEVTRQEPKASPFAVLASLRRKEPSDS